MLRSERGVTLIEILMALAITALLASTITFGRDQLRIKQQFSQGVDQLVETISNTRNEASTTVGQATTGGAEGTGGGNGTEVIYGKLMEIHPGGRVSVTTETIDDSSGQVIKGADAMQDLYVVQTPWGVDASTPVNILFGLQSGGSISTFVSTVAGHVPESGDLDKNDTLQMVPAPFTFMVQDSRGNKANITIDQYGNVSRVYL